MINDQGDKQTCKISLSQNGGFFIGIANYELGQDDKDKGQLQATATERTLRTLQSVQKEEEANMKQNVKDLRTQYIQNEFMQAFSSKWPYITYAGMETEYLIIINVFDPDVIHRIKIPGKPVRILKTFITVTNDLFFLV